MEILVVTAIIGILASVVLASYSGARERARDSVRISDLQQFSLTLALYRDANGSYPAALSALAPQFTPLIPNDPLGAAYTYATSGTPPSSYVIRATLERASSKPVNAVGGTINGQNCGAATSYCVTR